MIPTPTGALMALIGALSLVACWFVCLGIVAMCPTTPGRLKAAFVAKASGHFIVFLSALDYWHGEPLGWPWVLLTGVALYSGGAALLHLVNRRDCKCPECPVRRIVVFKDGDHGQ